MATKLIAGKTVQVNDEGFMTDPAEWSNAIAEAVAGEEGIAVLSLAHWRVIEFCRTDGLASGKAPTLRRITSQTGLTTKDMFALFPKGPAKKVARISGLGKPEGCV